MTPWIGKGYGTVVRDGEFRDHFAERGQWRLYFAAIGLTRSVSVSITSETELDKQSVMIIGGESQSIHLSVAIRWFITVQACSRRAFIITNVCSAKHSHACGNVRLDTTPDKRPDRGMVEDHKPDHLQSRVRFYRSKYGFPQISVDLGRVDSCAQKSVVERVAYTREVMGNGTSGQLGGDRLASISVIKAAKRPMLWTWNYQ